MYIVAIFVSNMAQKGFYLKYLVCSIQFQILHYAIFFSCTQLQWVVISTPGCICFQASKSPGSLPLSLVPDGCQNVWHEIDIHYVFTEQINQSHWWWTPKDFVNRNQSSIIMLVFKFQSVRTPKQQEILAIIISNSLAPLLKVSVKISGKRHLGSFFSI